MPRTPKTQRRELSVLQKGKIIGLLDADNGYAEIARQTLIPVNTIQSFCTRYRTRETHENIKRPGGPRLTTQAQDLELRAFALANTRLDHRQVKEQTGSTLSLRSIRRRLRKSYIRK